MRNADEIMFGRPVEEEEDRATHEVLIDGQGVRLSHEVYELWGYICQGALKEHYADMMSRMSA